MLTIEKIKKTLISNRFLVLFVFLLAAVFRISNLDLIEFKTDEAINLFLAFRPIFNHPFPPGGTVSSIGILNPPLFNYLLLPMALISKDPRFISFLIALLNVISISALFLIIQRYYSKTLGFITAVFMAISPWAIIYSRKIWMQDLLVPFFVLLFLSIHKLLIDKNQKFWILYFASSFFLIQLHQTSIIFIFLISLFLLLSKVKLNLKYILIGTVIGIIPLIPYVNYEAINKCPDCTTFLSSGGKLNTHHMEIFQRPFQILSQGDFRFEMGDSITAFSQDFSLAYKMRNLFYLEYILLPIGIFLFIKKFKKFSFFAYSSIILPFIYFLLKIDTFMHYYIIILPLLFMFLSMPFEYLIAKKQYAFKAIGLIVFLTLVCTSLIFNNAFFNFLNMQGKLYGDYGSTFRETTKNAQVKNIDEEFLSGFIPLDYMLGYQPLGKMLYGNIQDKDITNLDTQLRQSPQDKITQFKIIAFYTKSSETPQTLDLLKQKTSLVPAYEPIYKTVYQHYLGSNFKKEFSLGSHRFFYPEHWTVKEEEGIITLTGDGYSVKIKDLGSKNMTIECIKQTNDCNMGTITQIKNSIGPIY